MKSEEKQENAFPALHLDAHQGMTLRDYFAAKAMARFFKIKCIDYEDIAKYSYEIADEMLKQREL